MNRPARDSGVTWIGDIPEGWVVEPFRRLFRESKEINGPTPVGPMLSISGYRGVEEKVYESESLIRDNDQLENYRVVRPGQLAVNTMWLNYAGLGVSQLLGHVSPAYRAYWISKRLDGRYAHHLMRSSIYVQGYTALLTGIRPNSLQMSRADLMAFPVLVPPLGEQRTIADYLDRETAQIDAFIAKNEELITLLTERRNSVWADLYTEAASAARLAPLRRFVSSIADGPFGSSLTSAHYSDAGTRVIRLGNIGINEFKASDEVFISHDYAATLTAHAALPGDVIVAGLGDDRMPLGRACVLPDVGPAIVKADCYRVRPKPLVSPAYLAWVLSAPPTRGLMKLAARGSTRERLNTSVVLDINVPIPEADVQVDLVARFVTRAEAIDEACGVARRGVALARERRAALISAAVTGKIDVGVAE